MDDLEKELNQDFDFLDEEPELEELESLCEHLYVLDKDDNDEYIGECIYCQFQENLKDEDLIKDYK